MILSDRFHFASWFIVVRFNKAIHGVNINCGLGIDDEATGLMLAGICFLFSIKPPEIKHPGGKL